MYLPPKQAIVALREMRRIASHACIVHTFADDSLAESAIIRGNWVHAFSRLLQTAFPRAK
jgi:hypothetical protein